MPQETIRVRNIRSLPFIWIQRSLLDVIRPSWKGLLAYTALAYYADGASGSCRDVALKVLAEKVSTSEDSMRRGLEELVEKKAIRMKAQFRMKNGSRVNLPNEYVLIDLAQEKQEAI